MEDQQVKWYEANCAYIWLDIRSNQWFVGKLRKCKGKPICATYKSDSFLLTQYGHCCKSIVDIFGITMVIMNQCLWIMLDQYLLPASSSEHDWVGVRLYIHVIVTTWL